MSTSIHFSIRYDGPALASHEMDVRELAPALIALSTLLEAAHRVVSPDAAKVRVRVRESFKGGSFRVDLNAVHSLAQQVVSLLTGPSSTAAANLVALLTALGLLGTGGGLIGLIRWLRGRRPTKVDLSKDDTVATFEVDERGVPDRREVAPVVAQLFQVHVVRHALADVLRPLQQDGIDTFVCTCEEAPAVTVAKSDIEAFELARDGATEAAHTLFEGVHLQVIAAAFERHAPWRFLCGDDAFSAEVADEAFLALVEQGAIRFGRGDLLLADVRRTQVVTDRGPREHISIEHVQQQWVWQRPPGESSPAGRHQVH